MKLISVIILKLILQSFIGAYLVYADDTIQEIYRKCSDDSDCVGVLAPYPPLCRVFAVNKTSKLQVPFMTSNKALYDRSEGLAMSNCYNHFCTIYNKCENSLCVTSHELQKYSEFFDPLTKNCSKEKQ
jgi:hypothetical protein